MTAVISSNYDDKYFFYIPIVTWCWNKLGYKVLCICPLAGDDKDRMTLVLDTCELMGLYIDFAFFKADEECTPTYTQVSRLFAAALYWEDDSEILITGDVDMAVFGYNFHLSNNGGIWVFGADLTPSQQYPLCYIAMNIKEWREVMNVGERSMQECLDDELLKDRCENMRGNLWCRDQEMIFDYIEHYTASHPNYPFYKFIRARDNTQFANNRVDRDDSFYKDRLDQNIMDAHLWRPGYTDDNFQKIIDLLAYMYPNDNFEWMINYRNKFIKNA